MGNHHSHGHSKHSAGGDEHNSLPQNTSNSAPTSHTGSKKEKSLSRSASGNDIQDKSSTQFVPIEKLTKILMKRSVDEDRVQGVTQNVFIHYVFPRYPVLAEKLFGHLHKQSGAKTPQLSGSAFRQHCERFLGLMDDETVLNLYVSMYADESGHMTADTLRALLMTAYRVAMDHYADGPQMCLHIQRTLTAVIDSCFHGKDRLSAHFVGNWLQANCPRLLLPLHQYAVHCLTTAYRTLGGSSANSTSTTNTEADVRNGVAIAQGIELATPVLEQQQASTFAAHLLPKSMAWLLAGALPPAYTRPRTTPTSGMQFLARVVSAVPSHWIMLYNADVHGQGANRFLHHVLAYKGPTLILLRTDSDSLFCVATTSEWHESHLYWGNADSTIFQLLPKFLLVEQGGQMLYLNTTVRGYPKGLRAGRDPRKPLISIDGGFDKIEYRNIPYALAKIEVWGCGDPTQREVQLDVKKWQVKEAERQRNVKLSAADWLDHPDRYLLELAGRPQYNNCTEQAVNPHRTQVS